MIYSMYSLRRSDDQRGVFEIVIFELNTVCSSTMECNSGHYGKSTRRVGTIASRVCFLDE